MISGHIFHLMSIADEDHFKWTGLAWNGEYLEPENCQEEVKTTKTGTARQRARVYETICERTLVLGWGGRVFGSLPLIQFPIII